MTFRNLDIQHTLCFIFEFDSILQTTSEKNMSLDYNVLARIETHRVVSISLLVLNHGNIVRNQEMIDV